MRTLAGIAMVNFLISLLAGCGGGGGGNPPQATTNPYLVELGPGPYVVVATGQSNMVGFRTGGTFKVNSKVKIWDNIDRQFEVVDLVNQQYDMTLSGNDYAGGGKNNAAVAFCHRLQEVTGEDVYLVLNARNGAAIDQWSEGTYTTTLKANISEAIGYAGKSTIDVFLWMQGETDYINQMAQTTYEGHFDTFIGLMDGESYFSASKPFITATIPQDIVDTYNYTNTVDDFLRTLPLIVDTTDLNTSDGAHYAGAGLYDIGYTRMWNALISSF